VKNTNPLRRAWADHLAVQQQLLSDEAWWQKLDEAIAQAVATFRRGGKMLFCGNGGSAADAQHIAAELSGRFYRNRSPLYAEALHVNSSYLTAVANDFGYEQVFARMVEAAGKPRDILVAISTSGNSPNILAAARQAKAQGMWLMAWTGQGGGQLAELADCLFAVPSTDTPRIQETHILLGHLLCQGIETELFA
jgi:D-sedoheptulose 7-phosphate isomerase